MMKSSSPRRGGRRHATHRASACSTQAIPAVTLPEERLDWSPVREEQGQPAPCFSDANCGGGFTSYRHRQDRQHSASSTAKAETLGDEAARQNLAIGTYSEFLTCQ